MIYVSSIFKIRVLNKLRLLTLFRIGYLVTILQRSFRIPVIENKEGLIYYLNNYEPFLLQVFAQLNEIGRFVFLDAGVNFGQTLLKIKAINPSIPYIGFEPSGLCSYYTSQLIRANSLSNAKVIRCALSNSMGVLTLHSQSDGDMRATILDDSIIYEEDKIQELVPVVTLDSLVPVISSEVKEYIFKVDVEGAEWMVFQGSRLFIEEFRPVIVFENLPSNGNALRGEEQQNIAGFFSGGKYGLFLLDEINWKLEKITNIDNKTDYSRTNYIAIPEEKMTSHHNLVNNKIPNKSA